MKYQNNDLMNPLEFNKQLELLSGGDMFTPLRISVFSVCADLGSDIDLGKIYDNFMEGNCGRYEIKYDPFETKFFGNCLLVGFSHIDETNTVSKISAKIFCNGKIQIAGCKTINAVNEVPDIIEDFVEVCALNSIKNLSNFGILNNSISMINSNFKFKNSNLFINQQKIKDVINNNRFDGKTGEWRLAIFQPGKYHGVNIKYWTPEARLKMSSNIIKNKKIPKKISGQISVFVFRSGSITITGSKNIVDLVSTHKAITKIIENNYDEIVYSI